MACAAAAACLFPTVLCRVDAEAIPAGLDPKIHVVLSTLHGTFGEDGGMQRLLEAAGFAVSRVPGFGRKRHMTIGRRF